MTKGIPDVSVVIPCRNAAHLISQQLEALACQDSELEIEVIIADNASTDDIVAVVESFGGRLHELRVVDASGRRGPNHARNRGIAAARAGLIMLCDADDVVQPGWIAALAEASARCDLVGGRLDSFRDELPVSDVATHLIPGSFDTLGFLPYAISANLGFKKAVWQSIGGFDEDFVERADEIDFCWRAQLAGFGLCFVPTAAVWYRMRTDRRERMRQARMTSLGQVRLYKKHRVNGLTRRNPLLGLLRRCGRLVVDAPGAVRGGESTTQWLCHLAALRGHLEAAKRFGTWCP